MSLANVKSSIRYLTSQGDGSNIVLYRLRGFLLGERTNTGGFKEGRKIIFS